MCRVIWGLVDAQYAWNRLFFIIMLIIFQLAPHLISSQYATLMNTIQHQIGQLSVRVRKVTVLSEAKLLVGFHEVLCDLAADINEIYNHLLLVLIVIPFLVYIFRAYTTIAVIVNKHLDMDILTLIDPFFDVLFSLTQICVIVVSAANPMIKVCRSIYLY